MPRATKKAPAKKRVLKKKVRRGITDLPQFNWKTAIIAAVFVAISGYSFVRLSFASNISGEAAYESVKVAPGNEASVEGVRKVKAEATHPCAGAFEVKDKLDAKGKKICTSSNEKLPSNPLTSTQTTTLQSAVKVMKPKKAEDTISTVKATGKPAIDPAIAKDFQTITSAAGSTNFQGASPMTPTEPSCYGSGKDGRRLVLIAAGTKEKPITPADITLIQNIAGQMESTLIWNSYKQNPEKVMHWRFFQSSDCKPIVMTTTQAADYYNDLSVFTYASLKQDVGIQAAAAATQQQAAGQGLIPHYVVFTRSGGNACGQSDFNVGGITDNQEAFSFVYGATPTSRSGTQCWNNFVAQHETLHAAGAVDFSAPHTTLFAHCWDEWDIMCYDDNGGATPMRIDCPAVGADGWLADYVMDCNADDYFNVKANADAIFNPAPWWLGGQGFAHYNVAKSGFMTSLASTISPSTGPVTPPPTLAPPTPAPNAAPVVKIASPKSNDTLLYGGSLQMSVDATDSDGIAKVVFYNGTTQLGEDTSAPYSIELKNLPGTTATLKATAYDTKGLTATASDVMINIAPAPPVDTTKPVGPATLGVGLSFDIFRGGYSIDLGWPAATDNVKVTGYRIFRNNTELAKVSGTSYSDRAIGSYVFYTYKIFAEDAAGNLSVGSAAQTRIVRCLWIFCALQQ